MAEYPPLHERDREFKSCHLTNFHFSTYNSQSCLRAAGGAFVGFMKRQVLIFGIVGGALIVLLQWTEYRFVVIEHSIEIYGGLIAATFAGLGIWLGLRLTRTNKEIVVREVVVTKEEPVAMPAATRTGVSALRAPSAAGPFVPNQRKREELGITPRELEILELMAQGLSNREIAEKLFVSENTVKTHSSRVFDKLGAKRRTQAVQLGKGLGLLP